MEVLRLHGVNIVGFHLALGGQQWYIMGFYLSPDEASTKEDVVANIIQRPHLGALMVAVDFNSRLEAPEGHAREKTITVSLSMAGLEDISGKFLQRHKPCFRDYRTWSMLHRGRDVHSQTHYILGIGHRLLQNVAVWDARHNTDHCLLMGCLHVAASALHSQYLG